MLRTEINVTNVLLRADVLTRLHCRKSKGATGNIRDDECFLFIFILRISAAIP